MDIRFLKSCVVWLTIIGSLSGAEYFVNNATGDDKNDGRQPKSTTVGVGPFRTLGTALRRARRGDTIRLAKTDEPYRESVTLQGGRHSGLPGQAFRIDGGGATLDGTERVPESAWESAGGDFFRYRPSRLSHHQLFISGKPVVRRKLKLGQRPKQVLQAKEWCLFKGHVYFRVESENLPIAYSFTHSAKPVGLTLYECRNVIVSNLIVQGFQLDGVNAHSSVMNATLAEMTCRGNGRSGISVGGASRVQVVASLVGNNGEAQVRSEGKSITELLNCDLIDSPDAPAMVKDDSQIVQKKQP